MRVSESFDGHRGEVEVPHVPAVPAGTAGVCGMRMPPLSAPVVADYAPPGPAAGSAHVVSDERAMQIVVHEYGLAYRIIRWPVRVRPDGSTRMWWWALLTRELDSVQRRRKGVLTGWIVRPTPHALHLALEAQIRLLHRRTTEFGR